MKNKPLISILIPTYDRLDFLKISLDSCIKQKWFSKWELEIIVSDNSEDSITEEYIKANHSSITYNHNSENLWMTWNWNKLLELSNWEYFIFLSDDDLFYDDNSIKLLYDNLKEKKLNALYWLRMIIDEGWEIKLKAPKEWNTKDIYIITKKQILGGNRWWFWWILFKKFDKTKFDPNIWLAADWDFNINYTYRHWLYWVITEYTLFWRGLHNKSLSNSQDAMTSSIEKVQKKWNIWKRDKFLLKFIICSSFFTPMIIKFLVKIRLYNFIRNLVYKKL